MAAAHHQASSGSSVYEVFLSFHGKDVRTNFADHLYQDLIGAGIRTYRDEDELHKGNNIGPDLLAAIQQSIISIPIFSTNYASSKWCLNELTEISECRRRRPMEQIVFPIFYKIEPRDVRDGKDIEAKASEEYQMRFDKYQTGGFDKIYAKAFGEHQMQMNSEKEKEIVQKWKRALREVGELNGWHMKEGMYEGKLVKEVVKTVLSTLNRRLSLVSKKLVGIETHIKEMLMLLDIESNNRNIVGIHGLGGIGKTTIAKAVCNTVLSHFEEHTFIENVRENAEKYGIHYLQNQLIIGILKKGNPNIIDVDTGIKVIQQRCCTKKVLIVLDDVDQDIQAESLIGDREWFGIGSKIIITSRNKKLLIAQKPDGIYEPNVMALDDSLTLFSHYAFGRDHPLEDYLDLSKAMIETTGGLPLALRVIGSSLFKKEKPIWKDMLKKLQKFSNDDVMKRLKISYDGLGYLEKQIFLDTACFFIGMNKYIACHIWEGCDFFPQAGLEVLCEKSLLTISEDGELRMHDVLRDLGRDIVRQESIKKPGERSRIWSQEEVLDVLVKQTGTSSCEGLSIDFSRLNIDFSSRLRRQCLMSEGFAAMTELRLLQVDYAQFSGNFSNSFSELRWLCWRGCPEQYALTNFCPQKLAVLDLSHSMITENWMGWNYIKMAVNLKVLSLSSCRQLSRTPDVSKNRLLEVLILKDCENLVGIHTSIGYLNNLVTLDMSGCETLVDLPIETCQLTSLETLNLKQCKNLNMLPEKLGSMIYLTTLDITSCYKLEWVPNLPSGLKSLKASDCTSLGSLSMLSSLKNLEELDLSGYISDLPSSLTSLDISRCYSIRDISGLPSNLTSLDISFCKSLRHISGLPSSLTSLNFCCCYSIRDISGLPSNLTSLDVSGCESLQHISGLPSSLTSLDVSGCTSLQRISSLPSSLTSLFAHGCSSLEEIEGVDEKFMDFLVVFYIDLCKSLKQLPKLRGSKNLRSLKLRENHSISDFEGEGMESLETLEIKDCKSLRKIPYLRESKRLRELKIEDCPELLEIERLENYESLQELSINGARSLKTLPADISTLKNLSYLRISRFYYSMERLPDLSDLTRLGRIEIEDCGELTEIPGLDRLEILQNLYISGCKSLERLPDLSNLKNLKDLRIEGCKNLAEIHGLDTLEILENLYISGCRSLERLPDFSNLKNLKDLRIEGCKNQAEIHGLDRLEILENLYISDCQSLERLPDLSNLKNLKDLRIGYCKNLAEIHGLDRLEILENWYISGCQSLERLLDLSNLKNLKILWIGYCKNLAEIHGLDRLENLEDLEISDCESLERLPDLSNLKNLIGLEIDGCKNLAEILGIDRLENLKDLDIRYCETLKRLPDLSNLKSLKDLQIEGCKNLAEIHGIDRLKILEELNISDCESLESLPDLSNLKSLKGLQIEGCKNLAEIHGIDSLEILEDLDISDCESFES
ncbi:disease resistance protein TAO1-like [Telopea speciosissima]|uniref:disease resistance protein TAO1-like n=1 Tax=Telopea speciosissima TaxID=54955 RepID=UPI001CC3A3D8|nr:disease resistance protein TAO1-like [Telopea speciosissima]